MKYSLKHLPEVKAAITAAEKCKTIGELTDAVKTFDGAELAINTRAVPGRAGQNCTGENPVMVLGKAPAATETLVGQHFAGPAGQVLRDAFDGAGMDLEACWLSSASPWRARKDNTPNASQLAFSRPFLFKEIELVQPSVILCLGEKALEALTQVKEPFGDKAGSEITFTIGEREIPVVIMHNNAFVMYGLAERMPVFQKHLKDTAARYPEAFAGIMKKAQTPEDDYPYFAKAS